MQPTTHEPDGYECPFCRLQIGVEDEHNQASDVVAVTDRAYARVAPKWWPSNPGGALVIPRNHVENLYEMTPKDGHAVWDLTQQLARAMRSSYECEGISTRQHNEPAGDQDVWHLHVHVLPRFSDDRLYQRHLDARWVHVDERRPFADQLRLTLKLPNAFVSKGRLLRRYRIGEAKSVGKDLAAAERQALDYLAGGSISRHEWPRYVLCTDFGGSQVFEDASRPLRIVLRSSGVRDDDIGTPSD